MFDQEIYYKTAKGRAAIQDDALPRRLRSALLMVNGKTPWCELRLQLAAVGDPDTIIFELGRRGLVESDHELPPMSLFPEFIGNGRAA
ncbi:MAG: hypothetical protein QM803_06290 [Rhodocyclaceae bacterium]